MHIKLREVQRGTIQVDVLPHRRGRQTECSPPCASVRDTQVGPVVVTILTGNAEQNGKHLVGEGIDTAIILMST